jgi:hypothetical protein
MLRLHPPLLSALGAWISNQEPPPSRPEAIRRLLEQALVSKGDKRSLSKEAARKASKLAARELEKLGSQSQPDADLQQRKRTLIRGPKEFRDIRADLPKPKS